MDSDFEDEVANDPEGTKRVLASTLTTFCYIVMHDVPCKIIEISTSTVKKGKSNRHITAVNIFNNKRYEGVYPTTSYVLVPILETLIHFVIDITPEGFVRFRDCETNQERELILPSDPELAENLKYYFEESCENNCEFSVEVLRCMGFEKILGRFVQLIDHPIKFDQNELNKIMNRK